MPQHQQLAGFVVELLGGILTDLGLLTPAVAGSLFLGNIVQDVTPRYVIGDRPAAMSLALVWGLILALYNRLGDGGRRDGLGVEEVLLVGVFGQVSSGGSARRLKRVDMLIPIGVA